VRTRLPTSPPRRAPIERNWNFQGVSSTFPPRSENTNSPLILRESATRAPSPQEVRKMPFAYLPPVVFLSSFMPYAYKVSKGFLLTQLSLGLSANRSTIILLHSFGIVSNPKRGPPALRWTDFPFVGSSTLKCLPLSPERLWDMLIRWFW